MGTFDKIRDALRPHRITCRTVSRFLADYLDGTLDAPTRERFEAHLAHCHNCEGYFDQYRTTIQLLHEDCLPDLPPELIERTLCFLRERWDEEGDRAEER